MSYDVTHTHLQGLLSSDQQQTQHHTSEECPSSMKQDLVSDVIKLATRLNNLLIQHQEMDLRHRPASYITRNILNLDYDKIMVYKRSKTRQELQYPAILDTTTLASHLKQQAVHPNNFNCTWQRCHSLVEQHEISQLRVKVKFQVTKVTMHNTKQNNQQYLYFKSNYFIN